MLVCFMYGVACIYIIWYIIHLYKTCLCLILFRCISYLPLSLSVSSSSSPHTDTVVQKSFLGNKRKKIFFGRQILKDLHTRREHKNRRKKVTTQHTHTHNKKKNSKREKKRKKLEYKKDSFQTIISIQIQTNKQTNNQSPISYFSSLLDYLLLKPY